MFKWLFKKKGCAKHMNNKLEVIGIDHGWSMMKTISQVFVTGVKEITTTPALFGDVLEYEGKFYKVGTVRQEVKETKVEDDSFYLLTLAAVAKELKKRGLSDDLIFAGNHLADPSSGFVKPEWTTDSGNQSADGRMDPTALFSTGQCGLCAYVSEKMGTLYRLFHRIRIIGSGNEECDESLESGVCGIRTLYDPGNCR